MTDLWIDFNGVTPDGHAFSLREFASEGLALSLGLEITVGDSEGNTSRAVVVGMKDDGLVEVALVANTMKCAAGVSRARA